MIVVCDTGPLLAALDRRDRHHRLCAEKIDAHRRDGAIVVPVTVSVEVDYLARSRGGIQAARAFLSDLESGAFQHEPVDEAVLAVACEIDRRYAEADLGLVDASVIAVARSLDADAILTLDHAHFRLVHEVPCPLVPGEHEL